MREDPRSLVEMAQPHGFQVNLWGAPNLDHPGSWIECVTPGLADELALWHEICRLRLGRFHLQPLGPCELSMPNRASQNQNAC